MALSIAPYDADDHDEFFAAFGAIVEGREGFPQSPPLTPDAFERCWLGPQTSAWVVRDEGTVVGGYYVKPNFVGRASHIANAGYFVSAECRRRGIGRTMVVHSLASARALGFDAMMFNLVFASNPARALYRELGFEEIGVIREAVDGEDAVIYWRRLSGGRT